MFIQYMVLWNESVNSDGHQIHQYQQKKQLPLILTELTEQTTTYDDGNPDPCLGWIQRCGEVKPVNGITTLPFWKFVVR